MNIHFEQLRDGGPDCPSDLMLDRLHARELDAARSTEVEKHVTGCSQCTARMAERRAGFDQIEGVDPRRMLARIRSSLAEPESTWDRVLAWVRRGLMPVTAAAAVAMVAVVATRQSGQTVREKGSTLALHVFRAVGDKAEVVPSGDSFHPGDRIRFAVDLPHEGDIKIIGVEASGALYTAWPLEPGVATHHVGGEKIALPGAVALDTSVGQETLYLIYCATSGEPRCTGVGPDGPICQNGCESARFVLEKKP